MTSFRSSRLTSRWSYTVSGLFPGEATCFSPGRRLSCYLRGEVKRVRNRISIKLVNLVEIHEAVQKDEIKGQVVRERRSVRVNPFFERGALNEAAFAAFRN